jgi:hypothetical protein
MKRLTYLLLVGVVLLSLGSGNASAQVTTVDVNGTVMDPKGLGVPGAKITISNGETGFSRETTTGNGGDFAVTLLPPGSYKITVQKQGFTTVVYDNVDLVVGQKRTFDVNMPLGTSSETVTVTEEVPLIEATRSDLGGSVSTTEVKTLPLLDRNFSGLMTLVPGVRPAQTFDPTKSRSGNISLNGSDGRSFDYNVDGGDNKDNVVGGLVQNFTMEGIQEFNVVVNRYTAESGRTVAGVVNVISKSGTNEYHGGLFGLFQNSGLNKNDFFSIQQGQPKPVFHRYDFGGSMGGKIIRNKLFVFGAYEQKREPGSIPADTTAFAELSLFPLAAPVTQLPFPYKDHLLTVKMDYKINDKQSIYWRYGREKWTNPNDQLGSPFIADLSQTNTNTNEFHSLVMAHNYVISPNKVNSASVQFQDFVNAILAAPQRTFTVPTAGGGTATNPNIIFPSANIGQNVNVPQQTLIRKYQFRDDFSWTLNRHNMKFGVNEIYLAKLGGFFFFGADGYQVTFWDDPSVILSNTATYPQGFATPGAVQSILFSGGSGSTGQPPAHALAFYYQDDYKISSRLTLNLGLRWDANPNFLPQQLGPTHTSTNRTIEILQAAAAVASNPATADGVSRAKGITGDMNLLRNRTASWKEFQPRFGFAWDPKGTGKMVIRGGYGIARDQVFQNLTLFALQQANPTLYQTTLDLEDSSRPGTCGTQPLCNFHFGPDPLPVPTVTPSEITPGAFGRINDPRINDPWAQQSSIGGAYQFHKDMSFSVDYYHVLGTHEPRVQNINERLRALCDPVLGSSPGDPRCVNGGNTRFFDAAFAAVPGALGGIGRLGQINMIGTTNRSRFDSINVQLQKRMSHHVMFQVSDVISWAKSWGGNPTSSYGGNSIAITPSRQFGPSEYGYSNFDERNRFVASGVVDLTHGFEVAPIFQAATARPFNFRAGADLDGDGRSTIDRVCVGSTIANPIRTFGCQQLPYNTLRGTPFIQLDMRIDKAFKFGERMNLKILWEMYNLFNRNNFCNDFGQNSQAGNFNKPLGYCGGQGFGSNFSGPYKSQFGFRFEF